MKTNYLEKESLPIGILARNALSVVAKHMTDLLTGDLEPENKISYWQLVFLQSKANGCFHRFEDLPQARWQWPKDTWFQERLNQKLRAVELPLSG